MIYHVVSRSCFLIIKRETVDVKRWIDGCSKDWWFRFFVYFILRCQQETLGTVVTMLHWLKPILLLIAFELFKLWTHVRRKDLLCPDFNRHFATFIIYIYVWLRFFGGSSCLKLRFFLSLVSISLGLSLFNRSLIIICFSDLIF